MSLSETVERVEIRRPSSGRHTLALFKSELHLVFGRARTWVLLGVLAAVPVMVGVAIRVSGSSSGAEGFIGQIAGNGLFLVVASLGLSLPFFLPTAVTVISGESLAGEASLGTLRNLLTAPAGRAGCSRRRWSRSLCSAWRRR